MSSIDNKKYHWLKLDKNFFKRHDIKIVEAMTNGKDYILFYLKLLCESISHEGKLRFSETIPYNDEMLATITCTNIDIVRSAINIFSELKMIELFDDGTLYLNEVEKMIGSETYGAKRKREYRDKLENKNSVAIDYVPPRKYIQNIIELEKVRNIEAHRGNDFYATQAEDMLIEAIKTLPSNINWGYSEIIECYRKALDICENNEMIANKTAYLVTIMKNIRGE